MRIRARAHTRTRTRTRMRMRTHTARAHAHRYDLKAMMIDDKDDFKNFLKDCSLKRGHITRVIKKVKELGDDPETMPPRVRAFLGGQYLCLEAEEKSIKTSLRPAKAIFERVKRYSELSDSLNEIKTERVIHIACHGGKSQTAQRNLEFTYDKGGNCEPSEIAKCIERHCHKHDATDVSNSVGVVDCVGSCLKTSIAYFQ